MVEVDAFIAVFVGGVVLLWDSSVLVADPEIEDIILFDIKLVS